MRILKSNLKSLWVRFNEKWDEAGEIQRRIDDAKVRNQELYRHGNHRNWF